MVDLQNDFCKGGSLAVPEGDEIILLANQLQPYFKNVIATKDWHPKDHMSFAANHSGRKIGDVLVMNNMEQILWPIHCVQNTPGAELHKNWDTTLIQKFFLKGIDKNVDSYSAFFDNAHLRTTGLADYLLTMNIQDIYIMGLATDYCVRFSCMDAVHMGFNTHIILDACRGVELKPGDVQNAINEMEEEGVKICYTKDIIR